MPAARHGKAGIDDVAVGVGLRGGRAFDVQLGDLDVDAEVGEALDVLLVLLGTGELLLTCDWRPESS